MNRHLFLLLGLAACATDELAPEPDLEGSVGRATFATPDGPLTLTYVVERGHAIVEEDIDLGPVAKIHQRSGAANLGERWPNSHIAFTFDDDFDGDVCESGGWACQNVRTRVRQTLAAMEQKLPLRFEEVDHGGVGVVTFIWGDIDQSTPGRSDHVGMALWVPGTFGQNILLRSGHAEDGGGDATNYNLEPTAGTIRHEMLHAAGIWHEQARRDRDMFVTINWDCIIDHEDNGNFQIHEDSADLGIYDFGSIMHYRVDAQCEKLANGNCRCPTPASIAPKNGATISTSDAGKRGGFSIEDTNLVYRMYTRGGSTDELQRFGAVLAAGDFDADGYSDLAVGAPDTDVTVGIVNELAHAGRVYVYRGTSEGPVLWTVLDQQAFGSGEHVTADAQFGAAVVAYDADADGIQDLAIGAPGANGRAGAVFVWRGTRERGLVAKRKITQANTSADDDLAGDAFGSALAAGPIPGDSRDECVLPAPAVKYDTLAVGAPNNMVGGKRLGSVFLFHENASRCGADESSVFAKPTRLDHIEHSQPLAAAGDGFGTHLAIGDVDADGKADLLVGAPNHNKQRGAAYLYKGKLPVGVPTVWSAMATYVSAAYGDVDHDEFGSALAVGHMTAASSEIAIGSPGNLGSVKVYTTFPTSPQWWLHPSPKVGDRFGEALAFAKIGANATFDDLIIGVPGHDDGKGEVLVAFTNPVGVKRFDETFASSTFGDPEPGDRFGGAIATGQFNGQSDRKSTNDMKPMFRDLAISAVGLSPGWGVVGTELEHAGAVHLVYGGPTDADLRGWSRPLYGLMDYQEW